MKYKYTTQKNALKISREIMQESFMKKPVLAFVEQSKWDELKDKEDVVSINADDEVSLDYFMDKKIVFCTYQERSKNIVEILSKQWYDFMGGDAITVTVTVGDWEDVK
jgi:rhodanese-related sulfurtransferase